MTILGMKMTDRPCGAGIMTESLAALDYDDRNSTKAAFHMVAADKINQVSGRLYL